MAAKKRAKAKAKAGGKRAAKKTKAAKKKPAKKKVTKATKRKAGAAKAARAAKRSTRPRKQAASAKGRGREAAAPAKRRRPARRATAAAKRPATRRMVYESELALGPQRKGLAAAAEPPVNRDPANFVAAFRSKLEAVLAELAAKGMPFKLVEGFRTKERQQWLFGRGRTAVPFGRPGKIVTKLDGVNKLSRHQGNGTPGSGRAADCYPTKDGKVFIPDADHPVWKAYADAAVKQGLVAGLNFPTLVDAPHVELPP